MKISLNNVTILILIDGFLQYIGLVKFISLKNCHNPYFNRWFSAIKEYVSLDQPLFSHNPYFNRWFSAIPLNPVCVSSPRLSQSLF